MKKLWMIAGSALVMSACSDNVAEMNPAPAGNNNFVTLAEISASLPATRAYLEDVEFGAGKEVKTFWSSGDCITVWSEQEPERLLLYRLKSGADTPNAVFEVVGNEEGVHGTQFYALYNGSSSASKQITLNSVQNNNITGLRTISPRVRLRWLLMRRWRTATFRMSGSPLRTCAVLWPLR